MKRIFPLLALLVLAGCSTTSNDVTQNLLPLPSHATSWQCDSGNRIIVQTAKDGSTEMLYRGDTIKVKESGDSGTVLEGSGLVWKTEGLKGELSGTYTDNHVAYTERCTQVLRPAAKE